MIWHPQVLLVFPSELADISESLPADVSISEAEDWLAGRTFLKHRPQTQRVFVPCGRLDRFGLRYLRRLRSDFPDLQAINRGVKPGAILDALRNPLRVGGTKVDELGRPSQAIVGARAKVIQNPETGRLITTNPTSSALRDRLIREQGGGQ